MSKYTDSEIKDIIGKENYSLVCCERDKHGKRKINSLCPNGEEYSFYMDGFIRLHRRCQCGKCTGKNHWSDNNIEQICTAINIKYLGYNKEDKRKIDIKCEHGNITSPYLGGFIKKPHCSCEDCGGFVNWTEERIRQEIEPEGYTYISHYIKKPNNRTKVNSLCPSGNDYLIDIVNFHDKRKRRCQCEDCTGVINWTEEKIRTKVEDAGHTYLRFEIKDRYEKHIIMKCKNGNITESIIPNLEKRKWTCSCDDCTGKNSYTQENIIKDLEKNEYEYLNHYYDYTGHLRVECICPKGNYYNTNWWNFVNEGVRCNCCKNKSKAEQKISEEFDLRGIVYKHEHVFSDCKHIALLRFDFAIYSDVNKTNLVCLIEYDGIQHTKPVRYKGMTDESAQIAFELTVLRDNIKNEYCKNNNIPLLRVPYTVKLKDIYNYIEVKLLEDHGINIRDFFILQESNQQAS